MSYTITLTDGTVFATVADGTVNTSSSMVLVGKNYAGYGQFLDENFIHLLENSSNTTAPTAPLTGQLWWDKGNGLLKVYNGTVFKTISAATASATAPTGSVVGDLWWDTVNLQLKAWTGSNWLVIGPGYTSSQGLSGAITETINDNGGNPKTVVSLYVSNQRVGMVYDGTSFIPQASLLSTFPTVYPGITLSTANTAIFAGTANNSTYLNSLTSTQFMRSDTNTSTTGVLRVLNNTGLFAGAGNAFSASQSSNDAVVASTISGQNLIIRANVGGTLTTIATAQGSNGAFVVASALSVNGTASVSGTVTAGNVATGGTVSATGTITGGNVTTAGTVTGATINGTTVSISGNVTGGNIITGGIVSATGNITAPFYFGNGSQLTGIAAAGSAQKIANGTSEANVGTPNGNININIGGTSNVAVFATSGQVLKGTITVNTDGGATAIVNGAANAVGNIGSTARYFNRVFATSTTALYADVAERFEADEVLEAGTVVELGGVKEITRSREPLSERVFGVISSRAAFLMNGGAGEDDTHPPVAMTGRVPVKVVGAVRKGDRLVAAGDGLARAAAPGEATPFNVIGRALEDRTDSHGAGEIEAIVTIK
jgi:hypothetical protein